MIQFEGFEKLHIGLKSAVISVLCYIPFFFVAIYLMKKSLIDRIANESFLSDLDFWFLMAVCIALSIVWYFITLLASIFIVHGNTIDMKNLDDSLVYIFATVVSLVSLSAQIFFYYNSGLSFLDFIISSFTLTPFILVFANFGSKRIIALINKIFIKKKEETVVDDNVD